MLIIAADVAKQPSNLRSINPSLPFEGQKSNSLLASHCSRALVHSSDLDYPASARRNRCNVRQVSDQSHQSKRPTDISGSKFLTTSYQTCFTSMAVPETRIINEPLQSSISPDSEATTFPLVSRPLPPPAKANLSVSTNQNISLTSSYTYLYTPTSAANKALQ